VVDTEFSRKFGNLSSFLKNLYKAVAKKCQLCKDEHVAEIARRYFVMNAFDGALTVLGVIVGARLAGGLADPKIIISAGFGTSLAMGVSGAFGAYLTERSERIKDRAEQKKPDMVRVSQEALYLALVDGLSPAMAAIVGISPFFLSQIRIIPTDMAFSVSILLVMIELFFLGIFLGRIAGKSMIFHGLITLLAGLATFSLITLLSL